jgi:GNAT superfamily N-acetyltransferase
MGNNNKPRNDSDCELQITQAGYDIHYTLYKNCISVARAVITRIEDSADLECFLYEFADLDTWKNVAAPLFDDGGGAVIESMEVKEAYLKQGIGTQLLHKIIQNEKNIVVWAAPYRGNITKEKLIAFYGARGFKMIQECDDENIMFYSSKTDFVLHTNTEESA